MTDVRIVQRSKTIIRSIMAWPFTGVEFTADRTGVPDDARNVRGSEIESGSMKRATRVKLRP